MKTLAKVFLIFMVIFSFNVITYGDTSYFRDLVKKGNATYYDAYRIITILETGKDDAQSKFENLRDKLIEQRIIAKNWDNKKADGFVNRGEISYMLFKTLKLKGGLTVRIFGLTCRYAFRECVNKKLLVQGYANQLLSGGEIISILSEAENYQTKQAPKESGKQVNKEEKKPEDKQETKPEQKAEEKPGNKTEEKQGVKEEPKPEENQEEKEPEDEEEDNNK